MRFSPVTANPIIVSAGWDKMVKVTALGTLLGTLGALLGALQACWACWACRPARAVLLGLPCTGWARLGSGSLARAGWVEARERVERCVESFWPGTLALSVP